jgi:hypothetical protein
MKANPQVNQNDLVTEVAEVRKQRFVKFVERLARLRDLQYETDISDSVIERANKVVAMNLPSNLLRAAAIFVDWAYGFPPSKDTFALPEWTTAKAMLPESQRGSLACTRLADMSTLEENDVVVLIGDLPAHGLHAGMAGIVRELAGEGDGDGCLVEFGEPEDSITVKVDVPITSLRRPRPGDLLENYRL